MPQKAHPKSLKHRFRGFLPVVVDVETAGFDPNKDALLEVAAIILKMDEKGFLHPGSTHQFHIEPFEGSKLDPAALEFTGIDPYHPFRFAVSEKKALTQLFTAIEVELKATGCKRAVLVGHNAHFDLSFLNAAIDRVKIKPSLFHRFSVFDTVTLSGVFLGQTVLAKAIEAINLPFNLKEAHSAVYDVEQTANLFCHLVNLWHAKLDKQ